ncbi:MAG: CHAT domain-containing protein, partial [Oscillochloris sp.]|nr:CHAT domain-containing protein [Oscillochloris sp.]
FVKFLDEGYHLVIFYGHGLYEPRMGTSLMMERDDGSSRLFAAADLIDALRYTGSRPVLFILISCNTAAQRANPALDNLAIQIVRDGSVPAVVAMRDLVEVDLARAFTQYLCDHLLRYGAIDRAVSAARRQVMSAHSAGWSTPVLYMRSRDGRLFEPNAQLEFARLLSNDPQIRPTALSAPAGARLALLRARPDDQPNPRDARTLLVQLLALTTYPATAPLVVVSGGSRISRSLLLQQLAWQHNRLRIADASPVAIYLPLADDRSLQAGARIVDLLIDAAAAQDPAYGLALMNLLANNSTSNQLKFVLLIDGFEALSEAMRPSMAEVFSILARRNPALRIAVSVEESDAPPALCRDTIPWLILQPLSERQIRAYITYRDQKNSFRMLERVIRGDMRSLASDPQLLTAITEELTIRDSPSLSRETLLSGLLERLITRSVGPTATRTVVNDCLYALAWRLHWSYRRSLPISEALQIMRDVLEERSFVPEEVYRTLVAAGALVEIGGAWVQLSHLDLQAYIAVQSLCRRSDILAFLEDIVVMACFPNRLAWWSPVLVGVAQRADNLRDLEPIWRMLRSEVSGSQAVLAARCLGAFMQAQGQSRNALARLTASSNEDTQLSDLIDSILIELDPRFEPSAVTRAQLAEALGQLALPKVHTALRRQIFERVLLIDDLWQYDRPIVRIAAARALRDIDLNDPHDLQIDALRKAWRSYTVQPLLDTLQSPDRSIEERIFAAFALGDLCDQSEVRSNLVTLLLSEDDLGPKKEWQAIQATIADALILEADAMLARLLATELQKVSALSRRTKILVINIVGVCAGYQPFLIEWLYNEIDVAPIPLISGIACMALARVIACGQGDELHG